MCFLFFQFFFFVVTEKNQVKVKIQLLIYMCFPPVFLFFIVAVTIEKHKKQNQGKNCNHWCTHAGLELTPEVEVRVQQNNAVKPVFT